MTQEHPIIPPPELFKQWENDILNERDNVDHVLDCAWRNGFQAGADQELEACCEWLCFYSAVSDARDLRTARRPEPPSLKEQAQAELHRLIALIPTEGALAMAEPIRRALESLPD